MVTELRHCFFCEAGTETVDEDCTVCGLSKPLEKDFHREALALLGRVRLPHTTEEEMQLALNDHLRASGIRFEREAILTKKDRVDFLLAGGVAVECKVKGPAMAVFRQCERYVQSDRVWSLILLTAFHMDLPESINGKRCAVVKVGRAWL